MRAARLSDTLTIIDDELRTNEIFYSMSLLNQVQWKSGTILTLLTLLALGCQQTLPPIEPSPFQGVTLQISSPPALVQLVREQSRAWASRHQATVEVRPSPHAEQPNATADVWIVPPASVPQWAAAGQLVSVPEPLRERGSSYNWPGLLPLYREQLLIWDKQPVALPLVGESPVCVYRSDWFEDAKLRKKFRDWSSQRNQGGELRPPTSWEEFASLAEFFRDQHPSGQPRPSLPPLPADEAALDRLFYQVAAPYARRGIRLDEERGVNPLADIFAFYYDLKTGAPRLATPGFVAALHLLVRLQACRPQGSSSQPEKHFLDGESALTIADASILMEAQKRPQLRDRVGVTTVPGSTTYFTFNGEEKSLIEGINRVPYLGGAGWLAVVPTSSRAQAAAWDLLADLTGPTRSLLIAQEPRYGGGPTREEQLRRDRWDSFDLDFRRASALKEAINRAVLQHGIRNPVICLRIPDQARHRTILDAGLRRVLLDKADPRTTLEEVTRAWADLDLKRSSGTLLTDYRISLGLSRE